MSDQSAEDVLSGSTQAWEGVRRVREPVAWALLVIATVVVLVSAAQLFNVSGFRIPICPPTGLNCFAIRAMTVEPQFFDWIVIVPPVLSVVLVAFGGGQTRHARQVLKSVIAVQTGTLILGVVSTVSAAGATGAYQPASSYIVEAAELALVATALFFTVAVTQSQAVRSLVPGLPDPEDGGRLD
jgi:hypothetical protein